MSQVFMPSYDALYELYEVCRALDEHIDEPPVEFYPDSVKGSSYTHDLFKYGGLKDPQTGDAINTRTKALAYLGEDIIEVVSAFWFEQQYRLIDLYITLKTMEE